MKIFYEYAYGKKHALGQEELSRFPSLQDHWRNIGQIQGLDPVFVDSVDFDAARYMLNNRDARAFVANNHGDPLRHFLEIGNQQRLEFPFCSQWFPGNEQLFASALIYCPRPSISLQHSLNWLAAGGFDKSLFVSKEYSEGVIGNYLHACRFLLRNTDQPWIIIFENDVELCHSSREILVDFLQNCVPERIGCVSLYTPERYKPYTKKRGWNAIDIGWANVAGQALCFHRSRLEKMVESFRWKPFILSSLRQNAAGGGVDSVVGDMLLRMNLPIFFHRPSLAQHNGVISSRPFRSDYAVSHRGLEYHLNEQ